MCLPNLVAPLARASASATSHSSALHMSRRWGMTSFANIAVFFQVSSLSRLPNWQSTIRWPMLSILIASCKRWRTVAGLPAIT